jgi:hypothetical protein
MSPMTIDILEPNISLSPFVCIVAVKYYFLGRKAVTISLKKGVVA